MKVLLYTEGLKVVGKSGLGKAIEHQKKALSYEGIEYTTDPNDTYDLAHINFYGLKSHNLAKHLSKKGIPIVYHAHSTEEDFRDGFIGCKQTAPLFKKWLIECYGLGDVIITPTPYSKSLLDTYGIGKKYMLYRMALNLNFLSAMKKQENVFGKHIIIPKMTK